MKPLKNHNGAIQPARTDWIAVGDASRFIVYEKKKGRPFASVKSFANDKGRLRISDLEADQPGRSFDSFSQSSGSHRAGVQRHAYANHQDAKTHAVETFVREVTAFLDGAYTQRSFDRLILVTNSRLLGKMRGLLDKTTQGAIFAEHEKDLAWVTGQDLESRVQSLIALH